MSNCYFNAIRKQQQRREDKIDKKSENGIRQIENREVVAVVESQQDVQYKMKKAHEFIVRDIDKLFDWTDGRTDGRGKIDRQGERMQQ